MTGLTLANADLVGRVTARAPYPGGTFHDRKAARVNAAVFETTGGKLPCYAIPAKRGGFLWVSVGSSCVIARALATRWLARFGVDLDQIEAEPDAPHVPALQRRA